MKKSEKRRSNDFGEILLNRVLFKSVLTRQSFYHLVCIPNEIYLKKMSIQLDIMQKSSKIWIILMKHENPMQNI